MKKIGARLKQHIPDGPTPAFRVLTPSRESWWHAEIRDAIEGDRPEFCLKTTRQDQYSPQQVANRAAGELNEGRGLIILTLWWKGCPIASFVYASNGRFVFCLRSTDSKIALPVTPFPRKA